MVKYKKIIFYGIVYLVRNSIMFIFFMERDWQHKDFKAKHRSLFSSDWFL